MAATQAVMTNVLLFLGIALIWDVDNRHGEPVCIPACPAYGVCQFINATLGGNTTCSCMPGYFGDGYHCTAINPCLAYPSPCDAHASCSSPSKGTYSCTCFPNFSGDGKTCTPTQPIEEPSSAPRFVSVEKVQTASTSTVKVSDSAASAASAASSTSTLTSTSPAGPRSRFQQIGAERSTVKSAKAGKVGKAGLVSVSAKQRKSPSLHRTRVASRDEASRNEATVAHRQPFSSPQSVLAPEPVADHRSPNQPQGGSPRFTLKRHEAQQKRETAALLEEQQRQREPDLPPLLSRSPVLAPH